MRATANERNITLNLFISITKAVNARADVSGESHKEDVISCSLHLDDMIRPSKRPPHVHCDTESDPADDDVPGGQSTGSADPIGQYWFAGHSVGAETPPGQYDPAGHSTVVVTVGQYLPLAHASHETFPAHVTKVPGGQGVGAQRPGWSHL